MKKIHANYYGYWLLTQGTHIYLIHGNIPQGTAGDLGLEGLSAMVIGELEGQKLWLVEEQPNSNDTRNFFSLRSQLRLPELHFNAINRGLTLNYFFKTHQHCGICGGKTTLADNELALQCSNCEHRIYPVISPCIIVAVRKGKQLLLANHKRHKGEMYTVLAGFVEAGESLEQTVHREVFEETGIKINNLRYFASQPWALPNSLMVGFLADYLSGEICLQEDEIHDAKWFDYDQALPLLPATGTIASTLIQATLEICAKENK